MPRHPRYLEPGRPVVITQRCFQSRFLLRPSKVADALIVGVLAMAQRLYGMRIHCVVLLSIHLHFLASPESLGNVDRGCSPTSSEVVVATLNCCVYGPSKKSLASLSALRSFGRKEGLGSSAVLAFAR